MTFLIPAALAGLALCALAVWPSLWPHRNTPPGDEP